MGESEKFGKILQLGSSTTHSIVSTTIGHLIQPHAGTVVGLLQAL
ncbi:MAG: hypothetical protein SFW36_22805 [Leptolyngbyaceae cyanobacterium bins.59]|nr:hypothetical protein [Leptolyngbyaceae cyanobacterium bins.59]